MNISALAAARKTEREAMVEKQLRSRGIQNEDVLKLMAELPREIFVPDDLQDSAYDDSPLPIGQGQTISQPYIVAYMTEKVRPQKTDRVLEIGTGCGYQTAILAGLVKEVYTLEIVESLHAQSLQRFQQLELENVHSYVKNGYDGLLEFAPYDIILITAAPASVPEKLLKQLAINGRMICPVGEFYQNLILFEKNTDAAITERNLLSVRFVPMVHKNRN